MPADKDVAMWRRETFRQVSLRLFTSLLLFRAIAYPIRATF
jgi:hypothetical protein